MCKLKTYSILTIILLIFSYLHMASGAIAISPLELLQTILKTTANTQFDLVVWEFRLPRFVLALLVGLGLGIAGAVLQGLTRNPLADPGIVGVNAGAAMSIVVFIFFMQQIREQFAFLEQGQMFLMPLFGLVGGLIAVTILFVFSQKNGRFEMSRFILSGIAINSGFSAFTLFFSLKMDPGDFEVVAKWMNGSFTSANWLYVMALVPWLLIGILFIVHRAPYLDYFQLEHDTMTSIGIPVERMKKQLLVASVVIISAAVSVAGSISFIGLLAPHIARKLVGVRYNAIIPMSGMIGALLIVAADYIAKTVFAPSELAVGIVIAIIGIPYFFYLLIRERV